MNKFSWEGFCHPDLTGVADQREVPPLLARHMVRDVLAFENLP